MKSAIIGVSLVALCGTMLGSSPAPTPSASAFDLAFGAFEFDRPSGVFSQCVGCQTCGSPTMHELTATGGRSISPGSNHQGECWSTGECWQYHLWDQNCPDDSEEEESLTTEERQALWLVAASGDTAELLDALHRHPSTLRFNAERGSVQMHGCSGDIVANFPLSAERLAALQ